MSAFQQNALTLGLFGAAAAAAWFYWAWKDDEKKVELLQQTRGEDGEAPFPVYMTSESSVPLKDVIFRSQVGSKNMVFVKDYIGIRGTRFWQYYLPETNQTVNSARPLGFHLAH